MVKKTTFKQKNKPFKGGSKKNAERKKFSTKNKDSKKIKKLEKPVAKSDKKNYKEQIKINKIKNDEKQKNKLLAKNKSLGHEQKQIYEKLLKVNKEPKIIALIPINEGANSITIKQQLENLFAKYKQNNLPNQYAQNLIFNFPYLIFNPNPKDFPVLQAQTYIFVACPQDYEICLDFCKVADIICPIYDVSNCNVQGLALNPYDNANAYTNDAYNFLSKLRIQGVPSACGVLQNLEQIAKNKQSQVKKLFQRFFTSEFDKDSKFVSFENNPNNMVEFVRTLESINYNTFDFKKQRGFLLCQQIEYNQANNTAQFIGFLKGTSINPNQLVHITGYDDFDIQSIEVLKQPYFQVHKDKSKKKITAMMDEDYDNIYTQSTWFEQQPELDKKESLNCFAQNDASMFNSNQNQTQNQKANIQIEQQFNENENFEKDEEMGGGMQDEDDDSDIEYNDNEQSRNINEETEQKQKMQLQLRSEKELDFDDEAEYPADILVKDRFQKYKGMKNFYKTIWNQYDAIPIEQYQKIYIYQNYNEICQNAYSQLERDAFAYKGFFIRITLNNCKFLESHNPDHPIVKLIFIDQSQKIVGIQKAISNLQKIILSALLPNERKISIAHFKIKRNQEYADELLKSKEEYVVQIGFRKFNQKIIFSQTFQNCQQTKYVKQIKDNQFYYASFYCFSFYKPSTIMITKKQNMANRQVLMAAGLLDKIDPLHVILKRKILTGYPIHIHKRKAVVRFMFFNAQDVKYFQPLELSTKIGLRGHIVQSIGIHGSMKCMFNNFLKPNDIICLNLYKRVFPCWIL